MWVYFALVDAIGLQNDIISHDIVRVKKDVVALLGTVTAAVTLILKMRSIKKPDILSGKNNYNPLNLASLKGCISVVALTYL